MPRPDNRAALQVACLALREYLERAKRSADEEIAGYPKPIPRCDAQFNYLYELRTRLSCELERTTNALADDGSMDGLVSAITNFVEAAPYSDEAEERDLRTWLRAQLLQLG